MLKLKKTMTRKEEIQRKAGDLADFGISHCQPNQQQYYEGFIDGADWADQNPRKELWDSKKVIAWLMENMNNYLVKGRDIDFIYEDLCKAMED